MKAERIESTFSLRYHVRASVRARADVVWGKLIDAKGIPSWNSTVESVEGDIALGSKLTLRVPIAPGRTFTPKVVELVPLQWMVWRDGFAPMFQGTRTFRLVEEGEGDTLFQMEEVFGGLMLPLIKRSLPDFRPVFEQYARDLQVACERPPEPRPAR